MEAVKYKTKVDLWLLLVLMLVGVVSPLVIVLVLVLESGWTTEEIIILAVAAGAMFVAVTATFLLSYFAACYMLDEKGLTVRNTFFKKKTIPYSNIISFEEAINIFNRPKTWTAPLSVTGIKVEYFKENGNKSWFFIAPQKKQEFMQDLQNRISKNP